MSLPQKGSPWVFAQSVIVRGWVDMGQGGTSSHDDEA